MFIGSVFFLSIFLLIPHSSSAWPSKTQYSSSLMPVVVRKTDIAFINPVPPARVSKISKKKIKVEATAYSSRVQETDSSPTITASGMHVAPHIIAANFLPIGSKVSFPDMYGDQEFIVGDRLAPRYSHRVDFWKPSREEALQFGFQIITLEIESS